MQTLSTHEQTTDATKKLFNHTLPTLNLVIFSLLTMGLFGLLQVRTLSKEMPKVSGKSFVEPGYIFTITLLLGLSFLSQWIAHSLLALGIDTRDRSLIDFSIMLDYLSTILSLIVSILYIIWAFKAKAILTELAEKWDINLPMNGLLTLLFNYFYINYKTNEYNQKVNK